MIFIVGEIGFNTFGSKMTIIEFKNKTNVKVQFEDGFIKKCGYDIFKKGNVKNPYDRTVYNVGYLGEGNYMTARNKKILPQYIAWHHMLQRCYDKEYKKDKPTYKNCIVFDEWQNYQVFAKWYDDNFYQVDGQRMELDKDILNKGNNIYSPNNSIFVPQCINLLFIKNNADRTNLPIGVQKRGKNSYYSTVNYKKNQIDLGTFNTPEEAFSAYKKAKEQIIKMVADEYKKQIPQILHDALYNYKVEITD